MEYETMVQNRKQNGQAFLAELMAFTTVKNLTPTIKNGEIANYEINFEAVEFVAETDIGMETFTSENCKLWLTGFPTVSFVTSNGKFTMEIHNLKSLKVNGKELNFNLF